MEKGVVSSQLLRRQLRLEWPRSEWMNFSREDFSLPLICHPLWKWVQPVCRDSVHLLPAHNQTELSQISKIIIIKNEKTVWIGTYYWNGLIYTNGVNIYLNYLGAFVKSQLGALGLNNTNCGNTVSASVYKWGEPHTRPHTRLESQSYSQTFWPNNY